MEYKDTYTVDMECRICRRKVDKYHYPIWLYELSKLSPIPFKVGLCRVCNDIYGPTLASGALYSVEANLNQLIGKG